MKIRRTPSHSWSWVVRPRATVRWQLTLLYSSLFLICGAALLAITYDLFSNFAASPPKPLPGSPASAFAVATALAHQRSIGLHRLKIEAGIALAIMLVISGGLGWIVAGRILRPLRTITAATERISETNLHERIAMPGPRDELRRLADTIDRLLERLEFSFDAQRQFVSNASHELRTPFAMMRTTLDVAIAKPSGVPAQTRELDAELRVDLDHGERLLESFLALARAQSGQPGDLASVALEPIISAALNARADQIAARELTVQTRLLDLEVAGSGMLLERMIENVIDNAVRHIDPGGSIEITLTAPADGRARVTIDSSGPLLDQRAVEQLAQPFKRLGEDRTGSPNGYGLGLSIVAAITAAHGGRLDLYARDEGGLRVQITLSAPTAPRPAEALD